MASISHFFGTSENAVGIQTAMALITFLLIKTAHEAQTEGVELTRFARLISANLMHRRSLGTLRRTGPEVKIRSVQKDGQMSLPWT